MLLIDGEHYEFQPLPTIRFDRHKSLAYVVNPKVASTLSLNFIFYINHGYRYHQPYKIFHSPFSTLHLDGVELNSEILNMYLKLSPETFTIVRDPLRRFVSAFLSKIYDEEDGYFYAFRDRLTSLHGVDLSPESDPAQSCLAFAKWVDAQ